MDGKSPDAKSIREEINALFGLRWDTLVEWAVISWLSLWFWFSAYDTESFRWSYGPISGIDRFLAARSIGAPEWFMQVHGWVSNPVNEWFAKAAIAIAVIACVAAVRSYRLSGLRTVALVAAAVACEMHDGFVPIFFILLCSAIPAAVGCGIALVESHQNSDDFDASVFYSWQFIMTSFATKVVGLFLAPILAPGLLAMQLVVSFRTDIPVDPVEELNREAVFVLNGTMEEPHSRLSDLAKNSEAVS